MAAADNGKILSIAKLDSLHLFSPSCCVCNLCGDLAWDCIWVSKSKVKVTAVIGKQYSIAIVL